MKKKLILLMLCITFLFGLCGCNKDDNKNNNLSDNNNSITEKNETNEENKEDNNINRNENDKTKDSVIKEDENKQEERPTSSNNNHVTNNKKQDTINDGEKKESETNNNANEDVIHKEEMKPTTSNNNTNNNDKNNDMTEPIQEEIIITSSNLFEYFEIKRENIIPELNAFGERGTEEDFYYELLLSLKSAYKQKLVSANISVEFASETYLRSYNYNRQTGIGTVTDEYRRFYNNTDKFLCNIKNNSSCYITTCHIAGSEYINDKLIYYAYITEKLEPIRVGGSIILKK